MRRFLLIRLLQTVTVLAVISLVVFAMGRATGNPANLLLPVEATEQQRAIFSERWGLDEPISTQYVIWMSRLLSGDLGTSFQFRVPVVSLIGPRLLNSGLLALASIIVAGLLGISVGVVAALKRGTRVDGLARMFAILGQGMPPFFLALMLQQIFALRLGWLPISGTGSLAHFILPAVTLGWFISAGIMRLVRSSMIEALTSDYVTFARSKGVSNLLVLVKHALRNALISPVTFMAVYIGILIGSGVTVEAVFAWPGIGTLVFNSVLVRDFPVMQGVVLTVTLIVVLANFLADVLYALIDPRIRY